MKPYCVPDKTEKYAGYDMIRKHTAIPALPDARLRLLHVFLEASEFAGRSEVYGTVTALLQTGLDIHDRVAPGDDSEEEQAMRTRQLKVLAGDYYSSRFYELLAAAGEVEMIAELSRAIADVNRRKMELYLRIQGGEAPELREYLDEVAGIKVRLFEGFDGLLKGPLLAHWQTLLKLVGLCEATAEELSVVNGTEQDMISFRSSGQASDHEAAVYTELAEWLRMFAGQLERAIAELPSNVNRELLNPLVQNFKASAELKGKVIG